MKLWLFHPHYLDTKGLVGLWNEALLAQAVLAALVDGKKVGYSKHPELNKLRKEQEKSKWLELVGAYLTVVYQEGKGRGFKFNGGKIAVPTKGEGLLPIRVQELRQEEAVVKGRLALRAEAHYEVVKGIIFEPHPLFRVEG